MRSRLRKNYCGTVGIEWYPQLGQQETTAQDAQKGRSARPQRAKWRGVRFGTLSLSERCENTAWEKARPGAPGSGG
jgi:hypothetical protein